jgi:hypothetical protein
LIGLGFVLPFVVATQAPAGRLAPCPVLLSALVAFTCLACTDRYVFTIRNLYGGKLQEAKKDDFSCFLISILLLLLVII